MCLCSARSKEITAKAAAEALHKLASKEADLVLKLDDAVSRSGTCLGSVLGMMMMPRRRKHASESPHAAETSEEGAILLLATRQRRPAHGELHGKLCRIRRFFIASALYRLNQRNMIVWRPRSSWELSTEKTYREQPHFVWNSIEEFHMNP